MDRDLPPIPSKHYFTIGEVSELCDIKPHVLRYWEQEFVQLRQVKRRGNRRYYQPREVELIRHIRSLLYERGFTITGARHELTHGAPVRKTESSIMPVDATASEAVISDAVDHKGSPVMPLLGTQDGPPFPIGNSAFRAELNAILLLLSS
ncbi:MAG: MerR family transcriptional regulator [Ferrovum sp.]|nr:MerR family transcriptional regulator [Ferrovum sp.]NDU87616.1 MerR family transcriptional regulator [Ferrovum sp.]